MKRMTSATGTRVRRLLLRLRPAPKARLWRAGIALALFAALVQPVFAQPMLVQPEQAGLAQALAQAATWEVETHLEDMAHAGAGLWTRTTFGTSAALTERWRMEFGGYAVVEHPDSGRYGGLAAPTSAAIHARSVELTRLNLLRSEPGYSVLLGKAELALGVAEIHAPTDRFDARDHSHFLHARRLGRWQLRLDLPRGDDTLSLVVLPFEESDRHRRVTASDPATAALLATPWDTRSGGVADGGVLLRHAVVRPGHDFFVGLHWGPGAYPTLRQSGVLARPSVLRRPEAVSAFGGAVATLENWRLYGEALYQHTRHGADQSFLRYTVGTSARLADLAARLGLQDLEWSAEYAGDRVLRQAGDARVLRASEIGRPYRDTLLLKLRLQPAEDWTLTLAATRPFDEAAPSRAAKLDYRWSDNVQVSAQAGVRGESVQGLFGAGARERFMSIGLDIRF